MKRRDDYLQRLQEPGIRGYAVAVAAALAIMCFLQFESSSVPAAAVPTLCGISGLLLRWPAMPPALLITLTYFSFFPEGVPVGFTRGPRQSKYELFDFEDMLLIAAVMVYLMAQYRIFALMPSRDSKALRSPAAALHTSGVWGTFVVIVAFLIVGQIAWRLPYFYEPHFGDHALLRPYPRSTNGEPYSRYMESTQSEELSRFLLLAFATAIIAGTARLLFWYARLRKLAPVEARLIVLDTQWREQRRELARLETWRSFALGHDASRRYNSRRVLLWIVRAVLFSILFGLVAAIAYIYYTYPGGST